MCTPLGQLQKSLSFIDICIQLLPRQAPPRGFAVKSWLVKTTLSTADKPLLHGDYVKLWKAIKTVAQNTQEGLSVPITVAALTSTDSSCDVDGCAWIYEIFILHWGEAGELHV